ncbi:BTAD domain-containing putative transcriptional regulator [Modestobacter sp. URMC 112]
MTHPVPVQVCVLGPVQAVVGGSPAPLGGPRQRSVLARLVVAGGHLLSTDRIVDDLWSGEPPPRALASLQVHVSHLRRALEPGRARREPSTVLVSAAPGYRLQLPRTAVDAWRFDELLQRARSTDDPAARRALLEDALGCWSGPAYAEYADTDWAAPEVARLDELKLVAVEARADADLELGHAAAVVPALERHLDEHPAREEAVRLLTLALYRSGRQGDALAVLRRARDHLADELGVDPGPALRELEAAVLDQAPVLDRPGPRPVVRVAEPAPPPPAPAHSAELDRLLDVAGQPGGLRLVWLTGEPGAGKTTLADAVASVLADRGWRVARGHCPEVDGAPPGWAWSEVTRALGSEDPLDAARTAFWTARALADRLREASSGRPVFVVLDDVHRADDLTLQLLRSVADSLAGERVVVLATQRTGEGGEALAATRAALAGRTTLHLALTGLDEAGVALLAQQHGLTDASAEEVALLRERTGGNPLFVRELTRLLVAEGRTAARTGVPEGVRDVLRRRVERLPGPVGTTLRQAAVLGREVDVDLLAAVAGRDEDELLDALEAAVLAGLLDEPAPGRVRFTHALVRDTLYDATPLLRRSRMHGTALAALQAAGGADPTTLAHHAVAAASPSSAAGAVPLVVAAARAVEALGAYGDAARQWASALRVQELAGPRSGGDAAVLDLLVPSISAHARAGDIVSARAQQRTAVRLATRLGSRTRLVDALAAWDAPLVWTVRDDGAQDPELLSPLLDLLEGPAAGELPDDVRCRLLIALFREVEGVDHARAATASERALALARGAAGPDADRLLCLALNARGYFALGPDLAAEREALADEYLAAAAHQPDHRAVAHWLSFLAVAARTDLAAARRHVDTAVALAGNGQLGHLLGAVRVFSAALLVLAGRAEEGRAGYEAAAAQLAEAGAMNGGMLAMIGRFAAGFSRGDLSAALPDLAWLHTAMPGALGDAVVLTFLDAGRADDARAAWAIRRPIPRDYYWLSTTTLRAHAAVALGDLEVARAAYTELLPWAGRVAGLDNGTLVVGPVDEALAVVADAVGDRAAAAGHRRDAETLRAELRSQLAAVGLGDEFGRPSGSVLA